METRIKDAPRERPRGSQPTYKEWKLRLGLRYLRGAGCSQPTYKEWKQGPPPLARPQGAGFPAYLQGMETTLTGETQKSVPLVPSLPTRNGNPVSTRIRGFFRIVPSLPTRNGNGGTGAGPL